MTRIESAKSGEITEEVRRCAELEGTSPEILSRDIAEGVTVILRNNIHQIEPVAVGKGLKTKINANIGTSKDRISFEEELEKLDTLVSYGADAVMDLSTGGPIKDMRSLMLRKSPVPIGTVPIYEAIVRAVEVYGSMAKMTVEDLFNVIEDHGREGVDFITVHSGLTLDTVKHLRNEGRILDVVSRGGAFLVEWMIYNERENPLYEYYDRLLDIAKKYDMTLSLGDGMRPGCIADATDRAQVQELIILGELHQRAQDAGIQSMIEGPGHVPLNQVELNIRMEKELCNGAPFYVLGPLVTDIAMGYDHITAAIGGAVAASAGADFLCYVTPAEHIRLPSIDDVREGVIASKIAAHAADIAKGIPGAIERNMEMARRRKALDWNGQIDLSLDPEKVRRYRSEVPPSETEVCSMCGEFCAIRTVEKALKRK
ncbi:Phosphomethylpyrimidine synthase ThiC [hydrothermal vent metagenome]|uniref:Phosphomethylpyrimidine synthase ThiC n=1 Tax=hydrothermal vent metagenome TaxID=652676 RepID=A0A3B1CX24_9ZZZZ